MILGDLIYDSLPYLYTTGGVTAVLISDDALGRVSAILLVSAAMLIFHLRLEYRREWVEEAHHKLNRTERELAAARNCGAEVGEAIAR